MFRKKKEEGLPDLPPNPHMFPSMNDYSRELPPIDAMQVEKPTMNQEPLPKLPDDSPFPVPNHMQGEHMKTQHRKVVEMQEWKPEMPQEQALPQLPSSTMEQPSRNKYASLQQRPNENRSSSIPQLPREEMHIEPPPMDPSPSAGIQSAPHSVNVIPKNKPIFIKIDKFTSARDSLDVVKEKLTEVEELLRMIREVKQKEDQELSSWEKEMENIKVRIAHVSSEIFNNAYSG